MAFGRTGNDDSTVSGIRDAFQAGRNRGAFVFGRLKGRTFLYLLAIFAVFTLVTIVGIGLKGLAEQRDADDRANILAALTVTTTKDMKRQTDTMLGKILAQGDVKVLDCVKFPEMNGCYSKVTKYEEEYRSHQESYKCGKDNEKTCYRTVWEWEDNGSETEKATKAVILGQNVPYGAVETYTKTVSASTVVPNVYGRYYYPYGEGNRSGNIRYAYSIREKEYTGTACLDTSSGAGKITWFHDFQLWKNADTVREAATHPTKAPLIVFIIVEILTAIGCIIGGWIIVSNDISDGEDSGF